MTSVNDGKDVKSNQISGPKSKTYFIELYKSLDAGLSGECSGEERARLVCQSWRRVHSLCQHSAPDTQLHLINWLQQHTAHTILQTEWQSPKSKEQHTWLERAIDEFIQECKNAISKRTGGWSPPWEHQLQLRAQWFRSTLSNPWGHDVLKALLDSKGSRPSDDEVLEWLKLERGVMFVTRLRQLAASKCDDLALLLATALMDKIRAATVIVSDVEQAETRDIPKLLNNKESTFVTILREEAGFTEEVWMLITDIEFVLLYKGELRSRCIELAKRTPLRDGYQLVVRLHGRLERSPRDRKLWKNAREAATLVAQVVIARCMVVPRCVGAAAGALSGCAGLLALLLAPPRLRTAAAALAAPAATSRHLYTLAEAVHDRCKDDRTPFVCELYVRAITAGMNELERLKIKTEKESEARATEKTLASWFSKLGGLLSASRRLYYECVLTAFSVHPSPAMYERVQAAPPLAPLKTDIQETNDETNSEYGSWATDSRTQTNFVKTSETLNIKKTQKQANVLSTAIFAEGEALGLGAELCQDLAVLIAGPRVKTLSWDTDRSQLLESCRVYCERTCGGTRALTTELRFLNLDPRCFQHLPEERDDDGDLYYGIEKGYEHLVEFQDSEETWQDADSDEVGIGDSPPALPRKKKNKTKRLKYSSDEESVPLSIEALAKSNEKKERPHSKERSKERKEKKHKTKVKQETKDDTGEVIQESETQKKKKERKERKKKETEASTKPIARSSGSLARLVGMKVAGLSNLKNNLDKCNDGSVCITDSDYDSQGKSSIASLNSEGNDPDVLFDGLFSMEDIKSPEKNANDNLQRENMSKADELNLSSGEANRYHRNLQSPNFQTPLQSPNVNHVREEVKNSIKKLIEFRRYKNVNDESLNKTDLNTQRVTYEQKSSQHNAHVPELNTQGVFNTPAIIIHKEQIKQLNILQNTSFGRNRNSFNETAETLISPNSNPKRLNERTKKIGHKSNARKIEQQLKLNEPMRINNQQGLLETPKAAAISTQNKHQEIIKHLEKVPTKVSFEDILKTMPSSRPGQSLQKTETATQNIYQSIPQHISNTSPNLLHTKVVNTNKTVSQNSHNCSKLTQHQQHPISHKHEPSQRQFHSFLKDLQVSINAGASIDKHDSKDSPTQIKQTIQQKKPDNVPNTFARMSYLKNKHIDFKSKSMDKATQNKCIHGTPLENLQHLNSKGEIIISKVDKTKPSVCKEDIMKLGSRDKKPNVKKEMIDAMNSYKSSTPTPSIVKTHPTMSNILSSGSQKHGPNISSATDFKHNETMQPITPERTSFLSEKDQDDMLHLLRQQSLLNSMKGQNKANIPKSSVNSNVSILNNKTSLNANSQQRPSFNISNIKNNKSTSEPNNTNEKSPATAVLKVSNTKAPSGSQCKKRNAKETNKSTKDALKNSDWESVMNALLATKTPTRVSQSGPNALDIALNKDSFDRCYSSNPTSQKQKKIRPNVITHTIKSNPAISIQKPVSNIIETSVTKGVKKCEIKSKDKEYTISSDPQTNARLLPVSKPVLKTKPIIIENHLNLLKRNTFHLAGKPLPSVIQNRNDPFISGIKNSDYDLLDELMDDDLRQEIGELSDEEPYNVPPPNTTKYKNVVNISNISKKLYPVLNKGVHIHPERNNEPFENTYKAPDINCKDSVRCKNVLKPGLQEKKCTLNTINSDTKLRIISNEVISPGNVNNNINYYPVISNSAAAVRDANEIKQNYNLTPKKTNVCISHSMTPTVVNPESTVKVDAQTTNVKFNNVQNSHLNVLDPARVVLTVPSRNTQPNVMLIGNDFIYDSFSTIDLEQANVNASNYNHNTFIAVNQVPRLTVYHATQFPTSVVKPVVIEDPIVLPVPKNTFNVASETAQLTSTPIVQESMRDSIFSQNKLKMDSTNDIPVLEQIISKSGNEIFSKPTGIKVIDKDNANRGVPECDILLKTSKVQGIDCPEISQKLHKHNTCNADKNYTSVSHMPTSVIVSTDKHGTINSPQLDSHMKIEKSPMFTQNITKNSSSQTEKPIRSLKEDKINTVTPMSCHVKDMENTVEKSQFEDGDKQSKLANQHYDRIYQKRLRILKRKVEHRCHDKPIALPYEPIEPKRNDVDNLKNKNLLKVLPIKPIKDIELPKATCRRILLRSSNSLKGMKTQKTETHISKRKSKLIAMKMGKARMNHKSKRSSKHSKKKLQKTNAAAKIIETCDTTKDHFKSTQKPILEGIVESIEVIKDSQKLNIANDKVENKIGSHNTSSVEESIEFPVIQASEIKEAELPLKKEVELPVQKEVELPVQREVELPLEKEVSETQNDSKKLPDVLLKNIEDNTDLDINTLKAQSKETNSILMSDQISTNNNNVIQCVSDEIISEKNQKIKNEFKDKIIFEELPNSDNDQSKRYIRIKLPNGSFKATISGKVNVNIDSILEDPSIKSMLWEKMNCNTKCILNIKQISVQSKNSPSVIKTHIQDFSYVIKDEVETIDLISDDDEDLTQNFETEFGSFKIAEMNPNLFIKHQKKFSQRCEIRIERTILKKNSVSDGMEEYITNSVSPMEGPMSLDIPEKIVDYIEIDDSSNESENLTSTLDSTKIKDSEPVKTMIGNKNNLNNHILHDIELNNIDQNIKENEPINNNAEKCESPQNDSEFEIKDCSLKIEKCDKLIKRYEQLKIKNKKCFVNLVRCDSSPFYRNKTEDLKLLEESVHLSDVLSDNEELSDCDHEISEQSLKRVASMSILNDLSTSDQDVSRISPSLIKDFDTYVHLTENNNTFIDFHSTNCFADWLKTKSLIRGIEPDSNECKFITFGIEKTKVTSDDISTDCDSDRESNPASDVTYYDEGNHDNELNVFQAPSLVKIIIDFFANKSHILESLKPTIINSKLQYSSQSLPLKRKMDDIKGNIYHNKISKLERQYQPESLKNICSSYNVKNYNPYEVKAVDSTMGQDEHNKSNNESSLPICDITNHNTLDTFGSFEPLKSIIEKANVEKQTTSAENIFFIKDISMNMLEPHIEQNEKLECVNLSIERELDLELTKSLPNKINILKCKDGDVKENNLCNPGVVSNHIENVIEHINYVNEATNTQENHIEKDDENTKTFCRNKFEASEEFFILSNDIKSKEDHYNAKSTSGIKINNLNSSTKDDLICNNQMVKNNFTTPDVILNKNKRDGSQMDNPVQEFNSDYGSGLLIQPNTNNIELQNDKNVDSRISYVKNDLVKREKEGYNKSFTEKIDMILHETKLEEQHINNQLNMDDNYHSQLLSENVIPLSKKHNNQSVIPIVDMNEKIADNFGAVIIQNEVIVNFKEDDQKLNINIDYPCSSENRNLPCIDEHGHKSFFIETKQIKENVVELPGSLNTILEPNSESYDSSNKNPIITIPLEDVKLKNNLNDGKLPDEKLFNNPCSFKIYDLSCEVHYNDSYYQDLSTKHIHEVETEVIPFEDIESPNYNESIHKKTSYDQSQTPVETNNPCLGDIKDKEKDTIYKSSDVTLESNEIKPVTPLEEPEIKSVESIINISVSENVKNEQYYINTSDSLEKVNLNNDIDDIDLKKDLENQIDNGNVCVSNNAMANNIMSCNKLQSKPTDDKYFNNLLPPSLAYENNNVDNKEALPEISDLNVAKRNVLKNETSCLNEINKMDLRQKQIYNISNDINKEKVNCNKAVKKENNMLIDKPKQKNVTLVYKGNSRVVLEGSIYEDPVVGTCYVFPILNRVLPDDILSNVPNDKSSSVLQHFKNKVMDDKLNEENKIEDEWINLNALPKVTYLRGRLKDNDLNDLNVKKNKRNLKRKIDVNEKQHGKKYRKGKNIDYPKLTATAINDSGYSKEFKRLFDYCNSITFSYSRPFHIEHIDVSNLLKSWPIRGVTVDNADQTDFKNLLFTDEDIYHVPYDPLQQTFSEEISNCNDQQYACSNIIENNFSMGFGEGSDRVLHISKHDENISKFSAATLSDVKQTQPFLMSNHHEKNIRKANDPEPDKEQKEVFKRYLTYIQLKEKVRSFFENTTLELNKNWLTDNKIKCNKSKSRFPYELTCADYINPVPFQCVVQVVQVGQLPVSAAQNPVTCDPRVTQVTDASPSQCSGENSPHDSQSPIKTEYTELTTADISLPLVQEYERHIEAQESSKALVSLDNIPVETEIKTEIKDEISDFENDQNDCNENNVLQTLVNKHINNIEYPYELADSSETLDTQTNSKTIYEQEVYNNCDFVRDQKQHNSPEKTDQIAHAMNAAGITTSSETMSNSRTIVNDMTQNICQEVTNNDPPSPNNISKSSLNSMTLQQALAQILPPPLNPTSHENNQSLTSSSLTPQVLHIVQGKNSNGNQITLVDNSQNSVISNSNTPMLHIVQNKGSHTNSNPNTNTGGQHTNSFGGLSLVDAGLQQGNNQLLHIVNTGGQKNSTTGQLLKRVNLLTNLTNTQGSNEQKMVQFVCKSADGKSIQLNAPHQRSMVLRLQPIESNIQNNSKSTDCQELSPVSNGSKTSPIKEAANTQHEIKSRSVYEENYAKFIQSSNKSVPEKSTTLPKFNQAFGKQIFQDNDQKTNDLNSNNSHLSINSSTEGSDCQSTDNAINIDHIGQISSPPLLLRKSPAQTSQAPSNLVQQIKQTIAPMNIQTMHGGVIYTRQIPVNIGGGQTINLITVPSTELLDNDNQKQQSEVKFINQSDIESPIIKIVPHGQNSSSGEGSTEDSNNHIGMTNENGQSTPTQHQPVLTQMRIKLPMLSKTPQMVSGTRVVRPSFFQIQRNVIGGANQPVYQQLVLTAAPPLSQHVRLPQTQTTRQVKVTSDGQSSSESQMSTSTLEQLREFDMVLEQVKERSTVQPNSIPNNAFAKLHGTSSDTTDGSSVTSTVTESTQQVLYSIGNNQSLNVAYVNRKPNPTFVRSPDSSGIVDSPSSSTHIQIPHTVTSESTTNDVSAQPSQPKAAKVGSKSKSRPKSSSNSSNSMKINAVPPKTSTQKPLEDEQTTQRILYILAEYKEQVENSPDKDKPAPRRRSNPPSNPGSSKRKKSSSGSRRSGMRDMSPIHGEDTCRTMGSEDSSCGTSQGDCNDSCMDSHSPQDSPRKVVRKLTFDSEATTTSQPRPQPQRNVIVADGQTITVARGTSGKPTTAVLMPANYILPVSMVKGGQQIAIVTNRGPKILTVGGGESGTTNALLLQRLIGPAGLKPVLTRPGVRHVRLPTAAIHNLQAFNLASATFQPPDSTASPAPGSTPPELIETRATSSPWADRDSQEVKPERGSSPEDTEPWNLPSSADPHDYSYEETVRTDNMDSTVLDAIPDRYSPDTEAQRIFDKMFDVDSKRSYIIDSQDDSRCAYDIDASDCDDKAYHQVVQRRDGSRHHRFAHVTHAAAMRHKYAILEHELRLQKSLSEECEDLGVDSPSASELFPEAELLFGNSPAHDAQQHSHTPQPTVLSQCGIPQPDMDDQIATDHLLQHDGLDDQQDLGVTLGLDEGIVTVSEDGMQATIALDQEEFARSHPNTTFHSEPTEDGEIQPFTMAGLKGRHITSTVFHATRAPATVLVSAPPAPGSLPGALSGPLPGPPAPARLAPADLVLTDTRELHPSGRATQVIRRVCWDRRDGRFSVDESGGLAAGDEARTATEDGSRDAAPESPPGDDGASSPERHAELFWESNSTSERSEGRRPLDFSSDSEKCCKSPSCDETNSTDSSGGGAHARLDSVIKDARGMEPGGSADGSSADDGLPPVRTYPAKRSVSGKTRAGERAVRRRASARGVVKRGCQCCGGDPAPPRPKKSRQRKPAADFASN